MRAIWALLIDISNSMDDGFSGEKEPIGLIETGAWNKKIDAAKDILIRQVKNLPSVELLIIAFDDESEVIYQGPSEDIYSIQNCISRLEPRGQTNIARAIDLAAKVIGVPDPGSSVSAVILTDGLSNQGDPVISAQNFVSQIPGSRISSVLIDRSKKGEAIANDISIGGEVRDGATYSKLESSLRDERVVTLKDALLHLDYRRSSLEYALSSSLDYDAPAMVEFKGTDEVRFASDFMSSHVVPYIQSLESIENTVNKVKGERSKIKIHSISHYSPVKASVSGIAQALKILEELIIPWKREYARNIADLKAEELRISNEKAKAEAMEIEARTLRENSEAERILQESRLTKAKAEQLELENEKNRFELKKRQAAIAARILNDLSTENMQLSEPARMAYIHDLIDPVKHIMESSVEANVNRNFQRAEFEQ